MTSHPYISICLLTATLIIGCAPVIDQRDYPGTSGSTGDHVQPKSETELLRDDVEILRQHVEALEQIQAQNDLSTPNQMQAIADLNTAVATLRAQVDEIDRKQERQKQEIIDALSGKIADLLKKQAATQPKKQTSNVSYSGTAREHTVQSGETLSAIAQAYGSSVDAIKKANNMGGSDLVRVGQKLIVPVKE